MLSQYKEETFGFFVNRKLAWLVMPFGSAVVTLILDKKRLPRLSRQPAFCPRDMLLATAALIFVPLDSWLSPAIALSHIFAAVTCLQ